jgi:hypothetical protein
MKLQIEQWISNNDFSENINVLFEDSVICYRSGANRSSLLFSYLAFMTILKERIIGGVKPNLFPQGEWDVLIKKLQNDDKWEAGVFDATQQQGKIDQTSKTRTKDPIFNLNDNLRSQIKYWKDRRNDCAHYKDNIIDNYHVESFWAFITSNLSKITIEGGMQSLLNKISKHFDPTFTPPDKDITPLIREVEFSVERPKLKYFWKTILNNGDWDYDLSKRKQELIRVSLEANKDFVNDSLISILKANEYYLRDFLSNNRDKLLIFNFSPEEVREFWKKNLRSCDNILGLYTTFLRNSLIPQNEIAEANKAVVNMLKDYSPRAIEQQLLAGNNFLAAFKSEILDSHSFIGFKSFLWVNDRADLIAGIIKNYPADKDIICKLIEHYNLEYRSEWLLNRFDNIFVNDKNLTEDYKKIIETENLSLPRDLNKYFA